MTSPSAPAAHPSRRWAISSVRSPKTPQLRKEISGWASAAQYSYWLFSSTCDPIPALVPSSGSQSGDPAVIESPSAAMTNWPESPVGPGSTVVDPSAPQPAEMTASVATSDGRNLLSCTCR
jgi:hypothetical protein